MIKVSELLNSDIEPLIHGALISRIIVSTNNKYFATVSSYQKSTKVNDSDFNFDSYTESYLKSLKKLSNTDSWISLDDYKKKYDFCCFSFRGKEKAIYLIENDLKITKDSFYNQLYAKLFNECDYIQEDDLNEKKKNFIRGFCELRGSIDTNRSLLSMDYFYNSIFELGKARLLNEYFSVPYYIININFRDLQNQFVSGINERNTQLRLQLSWYANNIGLINDYKAKIIENSYTTFATQKIGEINYISMPIVESRGSNLFIQRLSHFSSKVFGRDLSQIEIEKLRNELGFDIETTEINTTKRNKDIVELVRIFTDDVCSGCENNFDLSTRTFTHRKTNRPYFEIHHNISFANKMELDHEDNLVKLCPVCHTCIKSGVGKPIDQKRIIENILASKENIKNFASHFFNTNEKGVLVENIYKSLR